MLQTETWTGPRAGWDRKSNNDRIVAAVARVFETMSHEIAGPRRFAECVRPRFAVAWILRFRLGRSLARIGEAIGRDHTVARHGLARAEALIAGDADFARRLRETERVLWPGGAPARRTFRPTVKAGEARAAVLAALAAGAATQQEIEVLTGLGRKTAAMRLRELVLAGQAVRTQPCTRCKPWRPARYAPAAPSPAARKRAPVNASKPRDELDVSVSP
jgi:hypothetical protein